MIRKKEKKTKEQRHKLPIPKMKQSIPIDPEDIKMISRKFYEQLYTKI